MTRALLICVLAAFVMPATAGEVPSGASTVQSIDVEGTVFKVMLADGRVLYSPDLVGANLVIEQSNRLLRVRIDGIEPDPDDKRPSRDPAIWLHHLSFEQPDGTWAPLCEPGPDGRRQVIPLAGRLQAADGSFSRGKAGDFEFACTGGAIGKCIRFGYHPWQNQTDVALSAHSSLSLYNACIRMVRADYGGGGTGTTRNGMPIDLYDDAGINDAGDVESGMTFEAGWTPDGAVCVNHPRVSENVTLRDIETRWPRLAHKTGAGCTEDVARSLGAVLFNRSAP
jgi:hypothetical protein